MENNFIIDLRKQMVDLNNIVIDGFCTLFGKKYKEKIIEIISGINVTFFAHNLSIDEIDEKLKEHPYNSYYLTLREKKKNNIDNFMLLDMPVYDEETKYEAKQFLSYNKMIKGEAVSRNDIFLVISESAKIHLRTYLHEIMHLLMIESLAIYNNKDILVTDGFISTTADSDHLLNEWFVEYLSIEVYYYILDNYDLSDNKFINFQFFKSNYLMIDDMLNNLGKRIFELFKKNLIEHFINGNARLIIKIIGVKEIKEIDRLGDIIIKKILMEDSEKEYNKIFTIEELRMFKENAEKIFKEVEKNYMEYLEVCRLEDEYVTKLEEKGVVRRV